MKSQRLPDKLAVTHIPEGDVHMESGGSEGATILFNLYSPDGRLTQMLDEQGNVLKTVTIENVLKRFAKLTRWCINQWRFHSTDTH